MIVDKFFYKDGEWVHIKMDLDPETNQVDCYMDGVKLDDLESLYKKKQKKEMTDFESNPIFHKLSDMLLKFTDQLTVEDEKELKEGYYVALRKKGYVYYLKLKKIKLSSPIDPEVEELIKERLLNDGKKHGT